MENVLICEMYNYVTLLVDFKSANSCWTQTSSKRHSHARNHSTPPHKTTSANEFAFILSKIGNCRKADILALAKPLK